MITPDDDKTPYTIPLVSLSDALITFTMSLPTTDDRANLPIVDITPEGVRIPLDFNETHRGLSFGDPSFSSLAQKVTCHPDPVPPGNTPDDPDNIFHDPATTPLDAPDEPNEVFHDSVTDTLPDGGYFLIPWTPLLTLYSLGMLSI
jgi:hypothetical protein